MAPPFLAAFATREGVKRAAGIAKVVLPLLLVAGVLIYIMILRGNLAEARGKQAEAEARVIRLAEKVKVTTASLDEGLRIIREGNARILARNAALEAARRKDAANRARLDERWKSTAALVAELEAAARRPGRKPCTLSPVARRALEDL